MSEILTLAPRGASSYSGTGPKYPWGGLYGGQIVAQALLAAGSDVDPEFLVHSARAYFIRRGRHAQEVIYEVDPIRDGRSFCTRRVVAHQGGEPILNLEASFQRPERSADFSSVSMDPSVQVPHEPLDPETGWSAAFERVTVNPASEDIREGRATAWMRSTPLPGSASMLMHAAALAFISDDLPTEAVIRGHPVNDGKADLWEEPLFSASLDHTIWFHRHGRADQWQLQDFRCHTFVGGRGLSLGNVLSASGEHLATVAQEVLLRVPI